MIRNHLRLLLVAALIPLASCDRKQAPPAPDGDNTPLAETPAATPPVAAHLGFASHIRKDTDLYLSYHHLDRGILSLAREMGIDPQDAEPADEDAATPETIAQLAGNEAFISIGPGAGDQFRMLGRTYRDFSAAWAGVVADAMFTVMEEDAAEPDFTTLIDKLPDDLMAKWLEVVEKDSNIQLPAMIAGWRPDASKAAECQDALLGGIDSMFENNPNATPVDFVASETSMKGYEVSGRLLFDEALEEARSQLASQDLPDDLPPALTPERIERLLAAAENLRLTIATGTIAGRVLVYVGNGPEGFQLAKRPEESLAGGDTFRWTSPCSPDNLVASAYLSKPMVDSLPVWFDSSAFWNELAGVVRPPVREVRILREILQGLADSSRDLARRDTSAWSAVLVRDRGWRLETRGGWPDPTLDYQAPLTLAAATSTQTPAIRAHWAQNRARNDLEWSQLEHFSSLIEAAWAEVQQAEPDATGLVPPEVIPRAIKEIRDLNRSYREEFRAGIGNEVAFLADFQGEVPPVPGISEETIETFRAPRFTYVRTVTDREKLDTAGASYGKSWESLTQWACEISGQDLPLIKPQKVESDDLTTWFAPLPFIGGDFLPGVTLNDQLWMLGTSRSMTKTIATAAKSPSSTAETGMLVEIDFTPVRDWIRELHARNKQQAEALSKQIPPEMQELATPENTDRLEQAAERLQSFSIRKWLDNGSPATRIHLQLAPKN